MYLLEKLKSIIKINFQGKNLYVHGLISELFYSLKKKNNTEHRQTLPKGYNEGSISNGFYEASLLDSNIQRGKLQIYLSHEHGCKNLSQKLVS